MEARILWAIVAGFLLGVCFRSLLLISWPFALFFVVVAIAALFFIFLERDQRDALIVVATFCIAIAGGIARMDASVETGDSALDDRIGSNVVIHGRVVAEPDVRDASVRVAVDADQLAVKSATSSIAAGVLAVLPAHTRTSYGDIVTISGKLELPEKFDTDSGRSFDYPMYLAKDGILYTLSFAQIQRVEANRGNPVKAAAIDVKHWYLSGLQQVLPEPEAGLAGGITVGDKRSIGKELSEDFQKVSLIHMVVLSGYNITVVINAVASALAWTARSAQIGAAGLVVVFFVLMAGGAASAARAGVMALIAMLARVTKRTFIAERALGVACFFMVLWNPFTLVFDPSFQLSVLATLGLILYTPIIARYMRWMPERFGLREILSSTVSTQLMVLPLLLYQNGNLSIVALPANLLALIAVPYAMAASFAAAIFGALFGSVATFIALPAYALLWYSIAVAQFFASLPFASVTLPVFGAWLLVAMYAALFAIYAVAKKNGTPEGVPFENSPK